MAPPTLPPPSSIELAPRELRLVEVPVAPVEIGIGIERLPMGPDSWMGLTDNGMDQLIASANAGGNPLGGMPLLSSFSALSLPSSVPPLSTAVPEPLSPLAQGALQVFERQVCDGVRADGVSQNITSLLSSYIALNQWTPLPTALVDRLGRFPEQDAARILDLAVRHRTPPAILDRLLQGTADQAQRILSYAIDQRAHPQTALIREPATGRFWRTELTGDILGLGAGKTAFAGRVVEVTEDGRTLEGGETRQVAILMGTQARLKLDRELPAMRAFQDMGIGDVRFYGMATVNGIFGDPVSVMVTNRAEGNLVTDFSRDVPASEQHNVATIVARDIARLTREGWDMSGDIQFILGHGTDGRPRVQWIDFECISRHEPLTGDAWADAYRASMARFLVPMQENGFPSRNPADILH